MSESVYLSQSFLLCLSLHRVPWWKSSFYIIVQAGHKVLDASVRAGAHLVMRVSPSSTIPDWMLFVFTLTVFISFLFSYYITCTEYGGGTEVLSTVSASESAQ